MKCDLCLKEQHGFSHHEPVSLQDAAYKLAATVEMLERRLKCVEKKIWCHSTLDGLRRAEGIISRGTQRQSKTLS